MRRLRLSQRTVSGGMVSSCSLISPSTRLLSLSLVSVNSTFPFRRRLLPQNRSQNNGLQGITFNTMDYWAIAAGKQGEHAETRNAKPDKASSEGP